MAHFDTAQPFKLQTAIIIVGGLIAMTGIAAVSALLIGLAHRLLPPQPTENSGASIAAGFGLGAVLAGLGALGLKMAPSTLPLWPSFGGAGDSVPLLAAALGPLSSWITGTAFFLLVIATIQSITDGWRRRQLVTSALVIGLGLVMTGSEGVESIPLWLLEGALMGLVMLAVWVLVLRHHPALTPLATAAGAALAALTDALIGAYPGAAAGSVIGALLVLAAAVWWFARLTADSVRQSTHQPPDDPVEAATGMEE
jgi:hypothetical protein